VASTQETNLILSLSKDGAAAPAAGKMGCIEQAGSRN
jgi:hypothetical protein